MSENEEIEILAKQIYEKDGFNFGCMKTNEAWTADREGVRERYRKIAACQLMLIWL